VPGRLPSPRAPSPRPLGRDRATLADLCNPIDPRARPPIVRSPLRLREPRPACARALRLPRSPASAWTRRSRSPSAPSPPRVCTEGTAEASPHDAIPVPGTGSAVLRSGRGRSPAPWRRQPLAEVSPARGQADTGGAWATSDGSQPPLRATMSTATPTRSARTPRVVRPSPRWMETPAQAGRSHRTIPAPRRARIADPGRVACADEPRTEGRVARLPRRRARSVEPEVPSTGEPGAARLGRSLACGSPNGASPLGDRGYPQDVTNLWRIHDAFYDIPGTAALDGATGTESSGNTTEG